MAFGFKPINNCQLEREREREYFYLKVIGTINHEVDGIKFTSIKVYNKIYVVITDMYIPFMI